MPELLLAVSIPVVITSFSIYTLAIIAIGLYSARYATQSDEDYFLAGRSLNGPIAALSASASSESGWVTLGLVGIGYKFGVQGYWVIPGCLLGYMFNWFVLAGRMSDQARSLNALTLPDFLCFRFRERIPLIRTVAVLVILAAMMAYVAAQMAAAGKAFGVLFDEMRGEPTAAMVESQPAGETAAATVSDESEADQSGYRTGVLVGAVIVLLYTVTGGFRAVCWTDFLQALLMVGALVVFPVYLLFTHGGFGFITSQLSGPENAHFFDLTAGKTGFAFLGFLFGSGALGINFGYPGQPHVLVRFMALAKRKDAYMAGIMAVVWGLLVYWGAVTIGLFACAMHASGETWTAAIESDQELSLVVSAMHLLPDVVAGLVLAAVLAAICSTADSQLVVAASSAAHDFFAHIFAGEAKSTHMLINRLVVLLLGIGAVLLVYDEQVNVYKYVLQYGWAMLGAAFGPQVILALLWKRASYAGCLAGLLVGFGVTILWQHVYDAEATGVEIYNLPVAFICAFVANIVFSLSWPDRLADRTATTADDASEASA